LKGFTNYSAFQIIELHSPFYVRQIEGSLFFANSPEPLPGVLVEIRDAKGRIRATKTDAQGRFKFSHLHEGHYDFKTTFSGFSSVTGAFIVQKQIKKSDVVKIAMPLGV
jgi:hypothetical protein